MDELKGIYLYRVSRGDDRRRHRGIVLSRSKHGFNWKSWACSLADQTGRQRSAISRSCWPRRSSRSPTSIACLRWRRTAMANVLILFIGLEFFYYWFHRSSHTVRWFWNSHSVHHSPNQLNLAAAYRLGWLGKPTGATIFFTPLAFLGFEPAVVLAALLLNLMYQFWIHAPWIPKLGWLEYVLNTPSAHRVHHARNVEYLDANYGGVLILF